MNSFLRINIIDPVIVADIKGKCHCRCMQISMVPGSRIQSRLLNCC